MVTPLVYGHRGASVAAPENTVAAFRLALELGADGVELDVRRSADGDLVVHHDAALGNGRLVRATATAELPGSVSSLADALDTCVGSIVNIEIKNIPGEPDFDPDLEVVYSVVDLLAGRTGDDVLVSSFHLPTIDRVKALAPAVRTGLLTFIDPDAVRGLARVVERGHDALHPHDYSVDQALVDATTAAGVDCNVWTVDDPARIAQLADMGVTGVVTNVPDVARVALS